MNKLPYYRLPDPPEKMTATGLMIRFVDSLGFRYRWATEGLREEDMEFQACDSRMKLRELLAHIHGLITSTDAFITGNEREKIEPISLEKRRKNTLDILVKLRESLLMLDDEYLEKRRYMVPWAERDYPIWFLINGPLSDAFTHVGQVASWRRINDNPIPGANAFYGTPPK
jgi:hypothetical protein